MKAKRGRKPKPLDCNTLAWSMIRAVASGEGLLAEKAKALIKERNRQAQLSRHNMKRFLKKINSTFKALPRKPSVPRAPYIRIDSREN